MTILEVNYDEDYNGLRIKKRCLDPKPFENPHDHHEFAFEVLIPNQPLLLNTLHCPKETLLSSHVILSFTPMISQFLDHVGSNPNPIAMTSHSMDLVEFYLPNHAFLASQVVDRIGSKPNLVAMTSHSMKLAESYVPTLTLITLQTMDIVGFNLKLAMDFNESSLSSPP